MSIIAVDWSELSLQVMITFVHFLWQACVICVVLVGVQHVCESLGNSHILHRRRGSVGLDKASLRAASLRYALACLAFFCLPVCVVATFALVHQARGPIVLAATESSASSLIPAASATDEGLPIEATDDSILRSQEMTANANPGPLGVESVDGQSIAPFERAWPERLHSFAPYLLLTYTIVVAFLLLRFSLSVVGSSRLRRTLQPITDSGLLKIMAEQSSRLELKRIPIAAVCQRVSVPVVVGILKPMILLPPALLCGLDSNQLAAIISHEMAHIRRYDLLVNFLQRIVEALLFFHPATWWISRRMSNEREDCCDDLAVAGCGRLEFAAALLHMAELCAKNRGLTIGPQLEAMAADGGKQSQLTRRVHRLLGENAAPHFAFGLATIMTACLTVLILGVSVLAVAQSHDSRGEATDGSNIQTSAGDEPQSAQNPIADNDRTAEANQPDQTSPLSHYEGTVLGADGEPMQGAEVFVISTWNENKKLGPVRDVTDLDGRFSFDAPDMTWKTLGKTMRRGGLLVAKKDGFVPEWMETWGHSRGVFSTGLWGQTSKQKLELQLTRSDVPIRGQLHDTNGIPLAGARVRLKRIMIPRNRDLTEFLNHWSKTDLSATFMTGIHYKREINKHFELMDLESQWVSDAEGRFEVTGIGRDRMVQLEITSPDILTTQIQVMSRDAENVGILLDGFNGNGMPTQTIYGANFTVRLTPGLSVAGVVRDRATKLPVAGMWVTHGGYVPLTAPDQATDAVVTDANGRFTLRGLDPKLLDYEKESTRLISATPQPGVQYLKASTSFEKGKDVIIETVRGIGYQLKLVDETGQPVTARVEYRRIHPNPVGADLIKSIGGGKYGDLNHAALRDDGTYEGFVLPGPGAVLVSVPGKQYRPAHVEPRNFFAPGKTSDENSTYIFGTHNILAMGDSWLDQLEYEAIVLVNPNPDSETLKLSATLIRDQPRTISLVDADGQPLSGAVARMHERRGTSHVNQTIDGSSFPMEGLCVDKDQWITFLHEQRKLAAVVSVRGDSAAAMTVRLQPWGAVKGRFVDEHGTPVAISGKAEFSTIVSNAAHGAKEYFAHTVNQDGTFQIDGFASGQSYSTTGTYRNRKNYISGGMFKKLILSAGEVRDLGDIQVRDPNVAAEANRPDAVPFAP